MAIPTGPSSSAASTTVVTSRSTAKAEKTKSGFRSRSSLKGGTSEFNEFTFDDKKGNELIFIQAQKDLTTYVKHDQTLKMDNCRIVTVK